MKLVPFVLLILLMPVSKQLNAQYGKPVRVGVVGLVHTHVHWILGREDIGDIEIVGIVEPNRNLAKRYAKQHGFSLGIVYNTIEEMLDATKPEAVTAFNTIKGHLEVVEKCAPRGIHIMVEKPLAVSLEDAKQMAAIARKHGVMLLTNYETSWYGSNHESKQLVDQGKIGDIRKIVVHDGHQGPEEISIDKEFLEWLIDPEYNGAGALTDFGCYGANLATWLMHGQRPASVTCVTQQIKPDKYPLVDDEATIILTYPKAQVIIQASWNWPYNRKDIEIYGKTGYVINKDKSNMEILLDAKQGKYMQKAKPLEGLYYDPFAYLAARLRTRMAEPAYDLSSLDNNLIVMEILDAAMKSARTGKTISLTKN